MFPELSLQDLRRRSARYGVSAIDVWRQMNILRHHDDENVAGTHFKRVGDRQAGAGILLAEFAKLLTERRRTDLGRVVSLTVHRLRLRKLCPGARDRYQDGAAELGPEMRIHLIVETCITALAGALHATKLDRRRVGEDDPVPDHPDPLLAIRYAVVI